MNSLRFHFDYKLNRIAIKLNFTAKKFMRQGCHYIFSDFIIKVKSDAQKGDFAMVFSKNKNKVISISLYDATLPIRIKRIYTSVTNAKFFHQKIIAVYLIHSKLLQTKTIAIAFYLVKANVFMG